MGNVFIKSTFSPKNVYELHVTTLQAIVLLYFNLGEIGAIRSFESLSELTNMGEEYLKRVLHSLSCGKYKVLKRITVNNSSGNVVISQEYSYYVGKLYIEGESLPSKRILNTDSFVFNSLFK